MLWEAAHFTADPVAIPRLVILKIQFGPGWKALIVWHIGYSVARYSDIKANLPKVTPHMLSLQLKSLEEDGLIVRTQYEEIPPRVEYCLTQAGTALLPILDTLCDWAILYYPEHIPADFIKRTPGKPGCGTACASDATNSS
ncbi:MAG: helix-turn-helix domain-containing protein [Methanocorpusculum sp.]|nr:helix-turn-helix domain-containing protein [Methanocorpusculum sp.]MDE2522501.1 helix-turn-helix domain-containing protein [Methanocorpusculum sp.]MDE2525087.1 helix-turn-helix domain-containing protein [Methanocorpusculum sp.]